MKALKLLVLILVTVCCDLSAQSLGTTTNSSDTINQLNTKGKKQGKWILYSSMANSTGYGTIHKLAEGKYIDGKKEGVWKDYYYNGKCRNLVTFKKDKANGFVTIYHDNGDTLECGNWQKDHWFGNYRSYYPNGNIKFEFLFDKNGKRNGLQKYYCENGSLLRVGNFKKGTEDGIFKEYENDGRIKFETIYKKGKLISSQTKQNESKVPENENLPF